MTRGAPIQASDLTALADAANEYLLPLVNAAIAAGIWPSTDSYGAGGGNFYDHRTSDFHNTNPQPAYSFSGSSNNWMSELNRIRGDYWLLIFGTNPNTGDPFNSDRYLNPDNILSGPWVVGVNDPETFPQTPTQGILFGSIPNGVSPYPVFCIYKNVSYYFNSLTDSDFSLSGKILSGGTLTADGTPTSENIIADNPGSGDVITLKLKINSSVAGQLTMPVNFTITLICITSTEPSDPGAPDVSALNFSSTASFGTLTNSSYSFMHFSENAGGAATATYSFAGTLDLAINAGETDAEFTFTVPPAFNNGSGSYDWFVRGSHFAGNTAPGVSDFAFNASLEFFNRNSREDAMGVHPTAALSKIICNDYPVLRVQGETQSIYGYTQWQISDPTVEGIWIANTLPVPGQNVFLDQDMPPYVSGTAAPLGTWNGYVVAVSKDVYTWISVGFPYFDNPPTNQSDNFAPILASSMRQQALIQNGYHYTIPFWDSTTTYSYLTGTSAATAPNGDLYYSLQNGNLNHQLTDAAWWAFLIPASENTRVPKYNLISQSEQCRPAPWLVQRDTDFVPFNFGFNFNDSEVIYSNQTATMDGAPNYYAIDLSTTPATGIKIRLVKAGSAAVGWKNGAINYGDAPPDGLEIFVSKGNSYVADFSTVNNEVTIPNDGGRGYLAAAIALGGLNFWVVNNNPDADAIYDLVIEVDTIRNPKRSFFPSSGSPFWPNAMECFSHAIDGALPGTPYNAFGVNKPIPQSGYCIFKVRATRLPVANSAGVMVTPSSGDEINIILGQNRLQYDNTLSFAPFLTNQVQIGAGETGAGAGENSQGAGGSAELFTIQIPANARDSGDVEVFIPVLGGNELVWQCDEMVIVEAWANWQPIFFAGIYGYYENYDTSLASLDATAFQYCVAFANQFQLWQANLISYNEYTTPSRTQFPMSVEIYNDLEACLNLI
jgi:hypothetical protein